MVDAAMLASELSLTNQIVEESQSGDFGKLYPGYTWTADINEVLTNKLFQVDYVVQSSDTHEVVQKMSVLFLPAAITGGQPGRGDRQQRKMKSQISIPGGRKSSPLEIRSFKIAGAFTLIEIMVAIAIFALLIAAVYSTWVVIIKSAQVGQAAAARVCSANALPSAPWKIR